jgi:hypothetical protein
MMFVVFALTAPSWRTNVFPGSSQPPCASYTYWFSVSDFANSSSVAFLSWGSLGSTAP